MKTNELTKKMGINDLNNMQKSVINAIENTNANLMVLSATGTGKTLSYLLPLVKLIDTTTTKLQAIVVVPGRELAIQSYNVLNELVTNVRGYACYGGRAAMNEHRQIRSINPHIIFTTPGRINDHIDKNNITTTNLKWLVIDEFDKCLEIGFQKEMLSLIKKLPVNIRQILLSATPAEEMSCQNFLKNDFSIIDFISKSSQISNRIQTYQIKSPQKDKLQILGQLLCQLGTDSSIVFLNYRDAVERTAKYLQDMGFSLSYYHGGLEQKEREASLYRFSNGSSNVLISTDLAARGLDIPNIKNIIHYHLPETEDSFIHRVGRTARWDAVGNSFFILGPNEKIPSYVESNVLNYTLTNEFHAIPQPTMATIYIGKGKKDKISKGDIVGFICNKSGLTNKEIGRIDVKDYYAYAAVPSKKIAEVLKKLSGEKIKGMKTIFENVK